MDLALYLPMAHDVRTNSFATAVIGYSYDFVFFGNSQIKNINENFPKL